jgi:hypothetical protein
MKQYRLFSWNVRHITHEESKEKSVIIHFNPEESIRITKITSYISNFIKGDNTIICLQEVNGDLLQELKDTIPKTYNIYYHRHSRTPKRIKHIYDDPNEYIVTIAHKNNCKLNPPNIIYFNEKSKGILVVQLKNVIILNVHLPKADNILSPSIEVINKIKTYITDRKNINILLIGDFNRSINKIWKEYFNNNLHTKFSSYVNTNELIPNTDNINKISQILGINDMYFKSDTNYLIDHKNLSNQYILKSTVYIQPKKNTIIKESDKIIDDTIYNIKGRQRYSEIVGKRKGKKKGIFRLFRKSYKHI